MKHIKRCQKYKFFMSALCISGNSSKNNEKNHPLHSDFLEFSRVVLRFVRSYGFKKAYLADRTGRMD